MESDVITAEKEYAVFFAYRHPFVKSCTLGDIFPASAMSAGRLLPVWRHLPVRPPRKFIVSTSVVFITTLPNFRFPIHHPCPG